MTRALAFVLLSTLTLSACRFSTTIPDNARVRCGPQGECPSGYECVTRLGLCRSQTQTGNTTDEVPPTFDAGINTRTVRFGTSADLVVTSSEPLANPPRVFALVNGATGVLSLAEAIDGSAYRFGFSPEPTDRDGPVPLFADGVDLAGNQTKGFSLPTSLRIDNTAPEFDAVRSSVFPTQARLFSVVVIRVAFSEALQELVRVRLRDRPTGMLIATLAPDSNQGGLATFTHLISTTGLSTTYDLEVVDAFDAAGNAYLGKTSLPSVAVDSKPPVVGPLSLEGKSFSAMPGFNRLVVPIRLDDASAVASACVASRCQNQLHHGDDAVFIVDAGYPASVQPVTVSATDTFGNAAVSRVENVTFDFEAPRVAAGARVEYRAVSGCPLQPAQVSAAGRGAGVDMYFSLDEPAAAGTAVAIQATGLTFDGGSSGGSEYHYQATIPLLSQSGTVAVNASVTDAVGNSALRALPGIEVDTDAPAALTPGALDKLVYRRMPWGSHASGAETQYSVEGAAGAFEKHNVVFVLNASLPQTATVLGIAEAGELGELPKVTLPNVDAAEVFVRTYDRACNTGSPLAARVRNVEWFASLGKKRPGSAVENPHVFTQQLQARDVTRNSATDFAEPGAVQRRDAQRALSAPIQSFRELVPAPGRVNPGPRVAHVAVADPWRQRLILWGGSPSNDSWEWNGSAWFEVTGHGPQPSPRSSSAGAADEARRRVVLFGGSEYGTGGSPLSDTWEWNGADWEAMVPRGVRPSARAGHGMAYDPVRQVTVLFGGTDGSIRSNEVWEWNGFSWQRKIPTGIAPSPRYGAALAWDPVTQTVLAFGGNTQAGHSSETWAWNGTLWLPRTAGPTPPARSGAQAALDVKRSRIVLWSGDDSTVQRIDDLWEWNGSVWTSVSPPATRPLPRHAGSMNYDANLEQVVVYGGSAQTGRLTDTWAWNGTVWTHVSPRPVRPSSTRSGVATAWDSTRARLMQFGGGLYRAYNDTEFVNDLWEWNGTLWTLRVPSGAAPRPRLGASMTYDATRQRLVVFGGTTSSLMNDTWEWDGNQWHDLTPGSPSPQPRAFSRMTFDSLRNRVVLFGGQGAADALNDTWEWDGSLWTQVTPTGLSPSKTAEGPMAFDAWRSRTVMIQGQPPYSELWEWNGTLWSPTLFDSSDLNATFSPGAAYNPVERTVQWPHSVHSLTPYQVRSWNGTAIAAKAVPNAPSPRPQAAVVFDTQRSKLTMVGGLFDDLWATDGGTWERHVALPGPPSTRAYTAAAYDSVRGRVVLFGGNLGTYTSHQVLADTWEWDGTAWSCVAKDGAGPSGRIGHRLSFDVARQRIVLFGGEDLSGLRNDTWEWNGTVWLERLPAAPVPPARSMHAMTYDTTRSVSIVHGGSTNGGLDSDLWEWNGTAWTGPLGASANVPARTGAAMTFDAQRGVSVLVGGRGANNTLLGDTWEWNGSTWSQATPAFVGGKFNARQHHATVWDSIRKRVLLFGGSDATSARNDAWEYDGQTWVHISPDGHRPMAVASHAMAFDAQRGHTVIFGGNNGGQAAEFPNFTHALSLTADSQVAHYFGVRMANASIPVGASMEAMEVTFVSGGQGPNGPGVKLQVWDDWVWRDIGSVTSANAAPVNTPLDVSADFAGTAYQSRLLNAPEASVRAVPLGGSAAGTNPQLATDYVEFRLRYRLP